MKEKKYTLEGTIWDLYDDGRSGCNSREIDQDYLELADWDKSEKYLEVMVMDGDEIVESEYFYKPGSKRLSKFVAKYS